MLKGQLTLFTTHLGALQRPTPPPLQTLPLTLHPQGWPPLPKLLEGPLPFRPLLSKRGLKLCNNQLVYQVNLQRTQATKTAAAAAAAAA